MWECREAVARQSRGSREAFSSPPGGCVPDQPEWYILVQCDPAYIQGLPEQMTKHFVQESQKQTAKLEQLKARVAKAGLVRNASYADPHALSHQVFEDLLQIFSRSQPKAPSGIEIEITTHTAYMDGHAWIGQGEKGVQLPESVISIMERIRKYAALTHFIPDLPAHFITFPSLHHISCRIVLLPESVACRPCT